MKLSELKALLANRDLRLTKSLGQNFLHDANQLRRIVQAAELTGTDKVLEIGPGLGPLTELLVAQAGEVLAIEKDARLVEVLRERFGLAAPKTVSQTILENPRHTLHLIQQDALEFLRHERRSWAGWKLVANLPYSVASPLLVQLAQACPGPERMVATVQIEVARRLMAVAGHPEYGLLTLLVQLHYQPLDWFKIPAGCFFPEPDVDSACVCLVRRTPPLLPPDRGDVFEKVVKRSFSQRRKMMLKLLKQDWPATVLEHAFNRLSLAAEARAETVTLEQFVELTQCLAAHE